MIKDYGEEMCDKCGNGRYGGVQLVGQPYQQQNDVAWHTKRSLMSCIEDEHLHYTCTRCGYAWCTKTQDAR